MKEKFAKAHTFLYKFKSGKYFYGIGILNQVGHEVCKLGSNAAIITSRYPGSEKYLNKIITSVSKANIEILEIIDGPNPNVPKEDLYRITQEINQAKPEVIVSFGGGSTTDAAKAAGVISVLKGEIDNYYGVGLVSKEIEKQGKELRPHLAIQTAASSAAHLTKYSNITDLKTNQKKLIVDEAIVPTIPIFDYETTFNTPFSLTADGAFDGMAHALEVLYSAVNSRNYLEIESIALEAIRLIVKYLPAALEKPVNEEARMGLGLGTDLGGYCIMVGGTNGAHLTSFSLVDILSHGRACGLMNPYYTVFFSSAIQKPLKGLAKIFSDEGYIEKDITELEGRELGIAVANAMISFEKCIGYPTTLSEIDGFTQAHIERALKAAKNPQLKMKLENMPVSLTAESVDEYMRPVLEAAKTGDLGVIKFPEKNEPNSPDRVVLQSK